MMADRSSTWQQQHASEAGESSADEPLVRFTTGRLGGVGTAEPADAGGFSTDGLQRRQYGEPTSDDFRSSRSQSRRPEPAATGWRGALRRATGLQLAPSTAEGQERQLISGVRGSFSGARHVLFANPKGGAGKTTTCLGVASTFGVHRGRGVVAFDNNPTRGTLGLRAQSDRHSRTVTDLLEHLASVSRVGDLSDYLRAQQDGHYAVLASDDDPRMALGRDESDYLAVMEVLDRFYEVVCVDTGNDVTAPVFSAAVRTADRLVVVTSASWDCAYSASWMLDHLEEHGAADLVRNAVTVVTLPRGRTPDLALVDEHFGRRTDSVLHVPFDPALDDGTEVVLGHLRPGTRRAWLDVAAAVSDGFTTTRLRPASGLQQQLPLEAP